MTSPPLVSVSLVTFNGVAWLGRCLKSLARQTYAPFEVFIRDNASRDGSQNILAPYGKKSSWSVIFEKGNLGFARGHNLTIAQSGGKYVLLLNQDIVLDHNFIAVLVAGAEGIRTSDKRAGSFQATLLKPGTSAGQRIDTTGLIMLKNRRIVNRGQGESVAEGEDSGAGLTHGGGIFGVDGAVPLYLRMALEEAQEPRSNGKGMEYFDEDFFVYKEDVDLAWRLRLAGWHAYYLPQARAVHWRGSGDAARRAPWGIVGERRKIGARAKYYSFRNQRLMQIKNEVPSLFLRHFLFIFLKEIGAWIYILVFERYTLRAIRAIVAAAPAAWKKRRYIMERKKATAGELKKWFQ